MHQKTIQDRSREFYKYRKNQRYIYSRLCNTFCIHFYGERFSQLILANLNMGNLKKLVPMADFVANTPK